MAGLVNGGGGGVHGTRVRPADSSLASDLGAPSSPLIEARERGDRQKAKLPS